ncbi:MAG: hypothetical protein KDA51_20860 [Planctomycetales bacterium]|nr:hypothetical protein [Planctomycetales bacterium]
MSPTRAEALTHSEIEAIVRVVLQRLRSAQGAHPGHSGSTAAGLIADQTVDASIPAALRLEQPLVTLEHLRDRWSGLSVLQVPKRCVVTPAVVDELRLRGVTLERYTTSTRPSRTSAESAGAKLLVLAAKSNQSGLAGQLAGSGVLLQWLEQDSHEAGLEAVRKQVARADRFCLWCTSRPFAAINACCQGAQLTAVQLPQIEDLQRAIDETRPHVIVVDSTRWRTMAVAQLVNNWTGSFA